MTDEPMEELANDHGVYPISVTSELSGVAPQMLRTYEQRGLLSPFRTRGGTRRYSRDDLARIDAITTLLRQGLNLAGIAQVLHLREETGRLTDELGELRASAEPDRQELRRLRRENRSLRTELAERNDAASTEAGPPVSRSENGRP
jgi:DNA-binding transcriptional MerR regulator